MALTGMLLNFSVSHLYTSAFNTCCNVVVCDISKIYQYHDHFSISLSFISNFDTALVDFDVYQKHDNKILKNISINIQVLV